MRNAAVRKNRHAEQRALLHAVPANPAQSYLTADPNSGQRRADLEVRRHAVRKEHAAAREPTDRMPPSLPPSAGDVPGPIEKPRFGVQHLCAEGELVTGEPRHAGEDR